MFLARKTSSIVLLFLLTIGLLLFFRSGISRMTGNTGTVILNHGLGVDGSQASRTQAQTLIMQAGSSIENASSYQLQGARALDLSGQTDEALARWAQIEDSAEYLTRWGNKAELEERPPDAQHWYENALAIDDTNSAAWRGLGKALTDQQRLNKAETALTTAIAQNPNDCDIWYDIGTLQMARQQWGKSIDAFNQATQLPNCTIGTSHLHYRIGVLQQHRQQNIQQAWESYERALEQNDYGRFFWQKGYIHWQRSLILLERDQFAQAETEARRAVELRPEYHLAYVPLADALLAQGNSAEAITIAQQALELNANYVGAYRALGDAYTAQSNIDAANKNYQNALDLAPHREDIRAKLVK